MPPAKSIMVNPVSILRAITDHTDGALDYWQQQEATHEEAYKTATSGDRSYAWDELCLARAVLTRLRTEGVTNDLARWWGRAPTASERIRLQQCVRGLITAGHAERHTTRIRVTDLGRQWLAQQEGDRA